MKCATRMNFQNWYTGELELLLSKAAFSYPRMKNLSYVPFRTIEKRIDQDEAEELKYRILRRIGIRTKVSILLQVKCQKNQIF